MIPTIPDVAKEGRYTAMQTARALQISRNTLLNYANAGLIKYRQAGANKRYYKGSEIQRFWRVVG